MDEKATPKVVEKPEADKLSVRGREKDSISQAKHTYLSANESVSQLCMPRRNVLEEDASGHIISSASVPNF